MARQEHTDITLTPVTEALLAFAAPRPGERVLDIGCGCGATTLEFARAVGGGSMGLGPDDFAISLSEPADTLWTVLLGFGNSQFHSSSASRVTAGASSAFVERDLSHFFDDLTGHLMN